VLLIFDLRVLCGWSLASCAATCSTSSVAGFTDCSAGITHCKERCHGAVLAAQSPGQPARGSMALYDKGWAAPRFGFRDSEKAFSKYSCSQPAGSGAAFPAGGNPRRVKVEGPCSCQHRSEKSVYPIIHLQAAANAALLQASCAAMLKQAVQAAAEAQSRVKYRGWAVGTRTVRFSGNFACGGLGSLLRSLRRN
jgi:hypothetical protein